MTFILQSRLFFILLLVYHHKYINHEQWSQKMMYEIFEVY